MKKNAVLLMLTLIAALLSCSAHIDPHQPDAIAPSLTSAQSEKQEWSQVEVWIRELNSQDINERQNAKNSILAFSSKSADLHQYVVGQLLKIVAFPNGCLEVLTSEQRFLEWKEATDILGIMKATEAIDALIDDLDCSTGASLSPDAYPATKAIIKIGNEAVPKLGKALENKPIRVRFIAAQALYEIGGKDAKDILQKAARTEKDERIRRMVKDMLRDWDSSGSFKS